MCQAPRGFDDEVGAAGSAPSLDLAGFVVPPQLALTLACVVLAHIVFCRQSLLNIRHERRVMRERVS